MSMITGPSTAMLSASPQMGAATAAGVEITLLGGRCRSEPADVVRGHRVRAGTVAVAGERGRTGQADSSGAMRSTRTPSPRMAAISSSAVAVSVSTPS